MYKKKTLKKIVCVPALMLAFSSNAHAIKIQDVNMSVINIGLAKYPEYVQAICDVGKIAQGLHVQVHRGALANNDETIALIIKKLLEPNKSFFGYLHQNSALLKPIVEKSFSATKSPNKIEYNSSFLHGFFKCDSSQIHTFFEQRLKTAEDAKNLCLEFAVLAKDLMQSLSHDTLGAYKRYLEQAQTSASDKSNTEAAT